MQDKEIEALINSENSRQNNTIELIASENFVSNDIKIAVGSCLTNKYAEGYPEHRYYGGCINVDKIEDLCKKRWLKVFNCADTYDVNVQPHSGSQANFAAYAAVLKPGDTILTLDLNNGGHLTHGAKVNFSGTLYKSIFYGVDSSGYIDITDFNTKLNAEKPALVLVGASAYPRIIDFGKFYECLVQFQIRNGWRPVFMVDMAHIAGLIAAGEHPSPFGYADIITTTTHKTLRGPRGGLIFCRKDLIKKVNSAVFPYSQGGPLMHVIAGKAVAAFECLQSDYKKYIHQVILNTKAMADTFKMLGYHVVTDGTDNHLFLLDFSNTYPELTGKSVQDYLDTKNITLNKNCVPNEQRKPGETSGVRIGCAAMTTKGWKEKDAIKYAILIDEYIKELVSNKEDK